jgi:hypothetical protein
MQGRGAPLPEVAVAEFNAYSALIGMDRVPEAVELLDRCEAAFQEDHEEQDLYLGLIIGARADLAANTGDPVRGVTLQSEALGRLYRSQDVMQIQRGHAALGMRHEQADRHSALALAHALAAAMLAELLGQVPDINAITRTMTFRAGEFPATPAALTAAVDEIPGVRFAELLENLSRFRTATAKGELLVKLLRQARASQRNLFDKLAEHCVQWDPVFAGIAASRRGQLATAKAVASTLATYVRDESWSQFSIALGHVFHQRPEAAAGVPLDVIDAILLRRCTDVLDGVLRIPPELKYTMPISRVLAEVVFAAQNSQVNPALARTLEMLAEKKQWRPLIDPIQRILAGGSGSQVTSGLDQTNTVIITTLLGHLAPL